MNIMKKEKKLAMILAKKGETKKFHHNVNEISCCAHL